MFFSEPVEDGPQVVVPSIYTGTAVAVGAIATVVLGIIPGPVLSLAVARREPAIRPLMSRACLRPLLGRGRRHAALGARGVVPGKPHRYAGVFARCLRHGAFVTIAVPVAFSDEALTGEIADDLAVVEAALRDATFGGDEMFTEVSRHMMEAGGKRFRAMLVLLAARFGDSRDKRIVPAAVAIELTHLATLFHDDVMDEAHMRRGSPSANSLFGNSVAILAGDYLFARASRILADLGPEAVRIQAETFSRLVDGQLAETVGVRPGADPLAHYMQVIEDKTGSLIATSGRFGAMFAGAPDPVVDQIADACMRIGVAWQLSDDVIDLASSSEESGKSEGTDLKQGVRTLPVLYALRSTPPVPEMSGCGRCCRWTS